MESSSSMEINVYEIKINHKCIQIESIVVF